MRIITYNVNGIRAALAKGLGAWLEAAHPDVLCLQEIKASAEDFPIDLFHSLGYQVHLFPAEKRGYSGTAILTQKSPTSVVRGMGNQEFDREGRVIQVHFGALVIMNVYFPSGSAGAHRQESKFRFLDAFLVFAQDAAHSHPHLVTCGDFNICHKAIDIHDPVGNKNSSGFLPEERAWMDKYFSSGFVDVFRMFYPDTPHQYTWWSYRANARKKNKGWRIDYITVTEVLASRARACRILSEAQHSDHCPVLMELDW
ncbi:MAG: exodeoxyribonuclease III [Flavobacteriales bacterium]|nr:exodeoxyribonuclease III [Flavobacteriales bacterium]MCX7768593.1 exodeoxyribonuclease III [Flavobacteriales bacterium]MDW8409753.1 exodeoxyribonuclease III [Flavobacteriales bacterium]